MTADLREIPYIFLKEHSGEPICMTNQNSKVPFCGKCIYVQGQDDHTRFFLRIEKIPADYFGPIRPTDKIEQRVLRTDLKYPVVS